ncbi:MAG: YezD family protein [Phycisphaerae bacterium]
MAPKKNGNKHPISDAIVKDIIDAVESLDYGSILIKVHDRKITQIEVTERRRLSEQWNVEKGGGI